MVKQAFSLPSIDARQSTFRQLPRAERAKLPPQSLQHLQQDPAEQSDPRSLEWIQAGTYFPARPNNDNIDFDALNKAQESCNKAFHAPYLHPDRVKYAREALLISEECVDGWNLLAEEEAETIEQALEYYKQAVKFGLRFLLAVDRELMLSNGTSNEGKWDAVEFRPLMRALAGRANCLYKTSNYKAAAECLERYLRLDPSDHLYCRPLWLACKLHLNQLDTIRRYFDTDDNATDACLTFIRAFVTDEKDLIEKAMDCNPFIPLLFTNNSSRIQPLDIPTPNTIHSGYLSEAVMFAHLFHALPALVQYFQEHIVPRFEDYLKLKGWSRQELTEHCLFGALHASFGGKVDVKAILNSKH